jgi:hypothetical protein
VDAVIVVVRFAADVDRDGWVDVVLSLVWYRNPGAPAGSCPFERYVYDKKLAAIPRGRAHDVMAADLDGGGRLSVITTTEIYALNRPISVPSWLLWQVCVDPEVLALGSQQARGARGCSGSRRQPACQSRASEFEKQQEFLRMPGITVRATLRFNA